MTVGHIGSAHVTEPIFLVSLGFDSVGPSERLSHDTSSVHPTVTCQLGQLDRYHSRRFSNGFIPALCFPPNAAASSSLAHPRTAPPPTPLPNLAVAAEPAMGCFLGCFGGAKERRRRRKRSPAQSPNGRARVTDSIRFLLRFSRCSFEF